MTHETIGLGTQVELTNNTAQEVLRFWLGSLDAEGASDEMHQRRWWTKDPELDAEILVRFEPLYDHLVAEGLGLWASDPHTRVAGIIVLDQFARNMFRGTPKMFAASEVAQTWALEALDDGLDIDLGLSERTFLYMPLMHAEALVLQDYCIELFELLKADVPKSHRDRVAANLKYAHQHRDIIARFGRFPHRNAILGRESTATEVAFLNQPGSSF